MRSIHQQRGQGSGGEAKYLGNWRWSSSPLPNLLKYVASFYAEGNNRQIVIIQTIVVSAFEKVRNHGNANELQVLAFNQIPLI